MVRDVGGGGAREWMFSDEDARDGGGDGGDARERDDDGDDRARERDDARRNVARKLSDLKRRRERQGALRARRRGEEARDELTLLLAIAVIDTQPVERGLELAYREVRHHETRCSVLSVVGRVAAGASPAQNLPLYRGRTRNLPD